MGIVQVQGQGCSSARTDAILYKSFLLNQEDTKFSVLWAFQFLDPKLLDSKSRDERNSAAGLTAKSFAEIQQDIIKAYNTSCAFWDYLLYAAIVLTFVLQVAATFIAINLADPKRP
jgi:hypothetical protein